MNSKAIVGTIGVIGSVAFTSAGYGIARLIDASETPLESKSDEKTKVIVKKHPFSDAFEAFEKENRGGTMYVKLNKGENKKDGTSVNDDSTYCMGNHSDEIENNNGCPETVFGGQKTDKKPE